jgi:hypothetical protein
MEYTAEAIAGLKRAKRFDVTVSTERGLVNDLSLDEVIVHVGNPQGAIDGWCGSLAWQVWTEAGDVPGKVYARINRGEIQTWEFPASLSEKDLLGAAQARALAEVGNRRQTLLAEAKARLQQLQDAA